MTARCHARRRLVAVLVFAGCGQRRSEEHRAAAPSNGAEASPEAVPETVSAPPTTPSVGAAVLQAGNVVFQTSRSAQSLAVQLATRSSLSHMGIVLPRAGRLVVFEAVGPVKVTEVDAWVARGVDGRVVVKRSKRPGGLPRDEVARLTTEAEAMLGRPP